MSRSTIKKPLIGFLPMLNNFGETYPLVEVAKNCKKLGMDLIFFESYNPQYTNLVKDLGCKIIKIRDPPPEEYVKDIARLEESLGSDNLSFEKACSELVDEKYEEVIINDIKKELEVFKKTKIDILVSSGFEFTAHISTSLLDIPLVTLISGAVSQTYFKSNLGSFPDNYENLLTKLIPKSIKNRFTNWYIPKDKSNIKSYNKISKNFSAPIKKSFLELFYGDYTLVVDDKEFVGVKNLDDSNYERWVGPILPPKLDNVYNDKLEKDIGKHIEKPGKSILLSMGSSTTKNLFIKILKKLDTTSYNVIAIYTSILNEEECSKLKLHDNIILTKFAPSIKNINEKVDLAIIHGGRGTVYTAAYSGKPVIGIPMHFEQQCNLNNLTRHGDGFVLSKKYFTGKKLVTKINKIFNNYDEFLKNSKNLKNKLPEPKGAKNAAKIISNIINHK